MLYKCIFTIRFNNDRSWADNEAYWITAHSKLVANLPGVVKYIQNRKVAQFGNADADAITGANQWDAVAELYFENKAAFDALVADGTWDKVMEDSIFADMEHTGAGIVQEIRFK